DEFQVHAVPLTTLTVGALKEVEGVTPREAERSKNMFALGLMSWLYGRPIEQTIAFLNAKFGAKRPEIAAANIKALQAGYAFGGALGVTTSAGPGVVLKAETIGLAMQLELPLVMCDIQRAGPSTGMPTKPEQGDLLMVLFGRNSESPVPVVAARSPSDCFDA